MGGKPSTPLSPESGDSDSPTRQIHQRNDRADDYDSSVRQLQHERTLMERAESSIQGLMYSSSSNMDFRRPNRGNGEPLGNLPERFSSSVDAPRSSRSDAREHHPATNRSYSTDSPSGAAAASENTSSSIGSSSFSHFLSNFNLWRASVQGSSDRHRAQSFSNMPEQASNSSNSVEDSEEFSLSNPRAVLNRLLSARETHSVSSHESSSQRRDTFSVRDLTFATAQELLAEASLNGMGRVYVTHSLPTHMWAVNGIKCPVCSKFVMPDDIECHLVMCLTKPRLSYNEDVLTEEKGECVICLEDLLKGHVIARLPCLCVYHKSCIDQWFDVNRSCPEHPSD